MINGYKKRIVSKLRKGTSALEFIPTFPLLWTGIMLCIWFAFTYFIATFNFCMSTEAISRESASPGTGTGFVAKTGGPFKTTFSSTYSSDGVSISLFQISSFTTANWVGVLGPQSSSITTMSAAPVWKFLP